MDGGAKIIRWRKLLRHWRPKPSFVTIRNAGLAYPIHISCTFPLSAFTELSLGLHEAHKFRSNLQQNLLNYNQIIEQGERSIQLRQMIQNQYLIQTISSHL